MEHLVDVRIEEEEVVENHVRKEPILYSVVRERAFRLL
jgi:hypothetical protein